VILLDSHTIINEGAQNSLLVPTAIRILVDH